MKEINARQLAFILKTSTNDARRMMVAAFAKSRGEVVNMGNSGKKKSNYVDDDYPKKMDVGMLSRYLNMPHLQIAIDDIKNNYMTRSATRGYIINYPLRFIEEKIKDGINGTLEIKIPPVLKSLLNDDDINDILSIWRERYAKYDWVEFI